MAYTVDKKDTTVKIDFTLAWDDLKEAFEAGVAAAEKNTEKNADIKGFRKGKVPKKVAAAQVDRQAVLGDTVDNALRAEYETVVKEEGLKFAGQPQVQVKKLAEGNDVEIELEADLMPEIALPKSWKKIVAKVNKEEVATEEITDETIDAELARLAESRAENTSVDRAAADGDNVKVDFTVKQDGVVIEGGTSTDHAIVLGSGAFIPGFEEEVLGMKVDEEKSFELSFPEKYHAEHLAGKPATFDVKLKAVEERIVPAIDDAFAASLGQDLKTVDDLKKSFKENMEKEAAQKATEAKRTQYLEQISAEVDTELPESMISAEIERMLGEMEQQIQASGQTLDDYLKATNKSREELVESWKPQARKRIISALLLEILAEELAVDVKKEEVEEEMNAMLGMYQNMGDDMKNQIDMEQMYQYSMGIKRNEKVFAQLADL